MPFIKRDLRQAIDGGLSPSNAGERAYYWYDYFVKMFGRKPSWNTIDLIYRVVREQGFDFSDQIAKELAWQVFFDRVVSPYEDKKAEYNGDIVYGQGT